MGPHLLYACGTVSCLPLCLGKKHTKLHLLAHELRTPASTHQYMSVLPACADINVQHDGGPGGLVALSRTHTNYPPTRPRLAGLLLWLWRLLLLLLL
jgi:hypothetical protein